MYLSVTKIIMTAVTQTHTLARQKLGAFISNALTLWGFPSFEIRGSDNPWMSGLIKFAENVNKFSTFKRSL